MNNANDRFKKYLQSKKARIKGFYDREAHLYPKKWLDKNSYYYDQIKKLLSSIIPPGKRVLDAGCGCGHLLDHLKPSHGIGIDFSSAMIREARTLYPKYDFREIEIENISDLEGTVDFVLCANTVTEMTDIRCCLKSLHRIMSPETRLVLTSYNYLWEPIIQFSGRLGLRPASPSQNWLSFYDLENMLISADFEVVREGYRTILPKKVPLLSNFCNDFLVRMPLFRYLGVTTYTIARPIFPREHWGKKTVSVVVPCKNEDGNVAEVVERTPTMGGGTEIIFVDDKSTDGTSKVIKEQIEKHPEKNIRIVEGPGIGKGAACRAGFAQAQNDILMILDADMTVMPEVLPEFFELIAQNKGEFINGSRLLYPMEDQAMRMANVFGNKMFAMLFTFLLEQPIKDTLCGTKVIHRRNYPKILEAREYFGNIDQWGDYDWIFGAARHNLKIMELPVHYVSRTAGETKMTGRLRNALIMLKMCWAALKKLKLV